MPSTLQRLARWARTLKEDGLLLWFALRHPRAPTWVKALVLVIVAYALSPIDLIPDVIPVLGLLDEALLLPALVWLALRLLPAPVREECRAHAQAWLTERKPRPRVWLGAVLVVLVWLAVAGGLAWALWTLWG